MPHTNKVEEIVSELFARLGNFTISCANCNGEANKALVITENELLRVLSKAIQETIEECIAVLPEEREMTVTMTSIGSTEATTYKQEDVQYNEARKDCIKALEHLKQTT